MAERAHRPIGATGLLAVSHEGWTSEEIGEAIYTFSPGILKWKGNESTGSKINRRPQVEAQLGIPMGDKGEDWETMPIEEWWVAIKDQCVLHVLVSPIDIWEILMGWNQGIVIPRQKWVIGSTGNA